MTSTSRRNSFHDNVNVTRVRTTDFLNIYTGGRGGWDGRRPRLPGLPQLTAYKEHTRYTLLCIAEHARRVLACTDTWKNFASHTEPGCAWPRPGRSTRSLVPAQTAAKVLSVATSRSTSNTSASGSRNHVETWAVPPTSRASAEKSTSGDFAGLRARCESVGG